MRARLLVLAAVLMLFMSPPQPSWATMDSPNQNAINSDTDLPTALDDDIFSIDDLPFEQRRQALREEVERNSQRSYKPKTNSPKYNLLIR